MLKWWVFVTQLKLPSHNGPNILIIYNNRNGNINDVEMAFINIRLVEPNSLKSTTCVTFLTIGGQRGVLAYSLTEWLAIAVLCHGYAFVVNSNDGHFSNQSK
ncbi:hypothetical protein D3C75_997810 [compost metagenome]